jgi:hypothetical protein
MDKENRPSSYPQAEALSPYPCLDDDDSWRPLSLPPARSLCCLTRSARGTSWNPSSPTRNKSWRRCNGVLASDHSEEAGVEFSSTSGGRRRFRSIVCECTKKTRVAYRASRRNYYEENQRARSLAPLASWLSFR